MSYTDLKEKVTELAKNGDIDSILALFTFENTKTALQGKVNDDLTKKRYEFLRGSIKEFSEYSDEQLENMVNGNFKQNA